MEQALFEQRHPHDPQLEHQTKSEAIRSAFESE